MKHHIIMLQDLFLAFVFILSVAIALGGSFKKGECEAEVSPMICIPMYKIPAFKQVE